jgi:hypothetical protein
MYYSGWESKYDVIFFTFVPFYGSGEAALFPQVSLVKYIGCDLFAL